MDVSGIDFVEGTYRQADNETPCIRMYCIALGSELLVQDFKSDPDEFPFRDPSCLLRCTPTILKDLVNMHIDDAHDDKMIAEETALQVHTRAQSRAAQTVSIIGAISSSPSPEPTADPIKQPTNQSCRFDPHMHLHVLPTRSPFMKIYMIFRTGNRTSSPQKFS